MEMLSEMESLGTSKIDFGVDEIEDDDSDVEDGGDEDDDDYDEDLVAVLDDSDEEDGSDEELGDWAKLETMRLLIQCIFPKSWLRNHINMVEQHSSSSKVQALYELCKKTYTPSGAPSSSSAIQKLCSLLDTIGPDDVGLKEENRDDRGHGLLGLNRLSSVARWAQPVTYVDVYECDSFTMCIFCFPTSSVIPLHDHPSMTVFSKVLYGSLHVKAYDWVEPACYSKNKGPGYPTVRLAKLTVDKILTAPCETSVLYPKRGGNLHCFTAVSPCAVLDILTPPYRENAGRKCTYYHDYPFTTFSRGNGAEIDDEKIDEHAWLAEIDTPDDLYMRQGDYTGPAVQDHVIVESKCNVLTEEAIEMLKFELNG